MARVDREVGDRDRARHAGVEAELARIVPPGDDIALPFGEELASELKRYVEVRDREAEKQSSAFFLFFHCERITAGKVYEIVKKHLSMVTSMKKRSPHVLRHTFATALLNNGAGLEGVRQLLGHESLQTTEIYTHTTFEQLKRVYKDAHPRGDE